MTNLKLYKDYWNSLIINPEHPAKSFSIGVITFSIVLLLLLLTAFLFKDCPDVLVKKISSPILDLAIIWSIANLTFINHLLQSIPKGLMADIGETNNFVRRSLFLGNFFNALLGIGLPIILTMLFWGNFFETLIGIIGWILYIDVIQRDMKVKH